MTKQTTFQKTNWKHRYSHGGSLRQLRAGRSARPLSTRESLHLVLKANKDRIKGGFRTANRFRLIHHLIQKYRFKFFIKIEQISIQNDHIHFMIRTTRRSLYQHFFRVLAGQIAQRFEKEGLLTVSVTNSETVSRGERVTDTPKRGVRGKGRALEVSERLQVNRNGESAEEELDKVTKKLQKLWKFRPFTRVVKGRKAHLTLRNYIQLNEKEALHEIPYRKERLRGLSLREWEILWS